MIIPAIQTLACAALVVYFGRFLKRNIHFIDKYNLPSPVIGGFVVAAVIAVLKGYGLVQIDFDTYFREPLMIAFFASVGYAASFRLLKAGGKAVIVFLLLSIGGLLMQIAFGVGTAYFLDLPLLMGVLTGPVALTGGPGTALAFGPSFEAAGVEGATAIGLTAAMIGILLGGLIGTPLSTWLINRNGLRGPGRDEDDHQEHGVLKAAVGKDLLMHFLALALIVGVGTLLSNWIDDYGITLPVYIGAMIVAALVRNIEDVRPVFKISPEWVEEIGSVALVLFIALAIMTLQLQELKDAAFYLFVFMVVQSVVVLLTAAGPAFWVAGRDYDAAVMSAGYVGFMMGTTANAMANMSSLTHKYGLSPKAFLVIPLVGSCFIDFFNAGIVTFCLNYMK